MARTGNLPFIPVRTRKPALTARTVLFYMLDCTIARRIFGILRVFSSNLPDGTAVFWQQARIDVFLLPFRENPLFFARFGAFVVYHSGFRISRKT
jgi:hypothetical protein